MLRTASGPSAGRAAHPALCFPVDPAEPLTDQTREQMPKALLGPESARSGGRGQRRVLTVAQPLLPRASCLPQLVSDNAQGRHVGGDDRGHGIRPGPATSAIWVLAVAQPVPHQATDHPDRSSEPGISAARGRMVTVKERRSAPRRSRRAAWPCRPRWTARWPAPRSHARCRACRCRVRSSPYVRQG